MARKSCVGREFSTRRRTARPDLVVRHLAAILPSSVWTPGWRLRPSPTSRQPPRPPRPWRTQSATGRSHSYSAWQSAAAELQVLRRKFDGPATANERTSAALAFLYQAWEYAGSWIATPMTSPWKWASWRVLVCRTMIAVGSLPEPV